MTSSAPSASPSLASLAFTAATVSVRKYTATPVSKKSSRLAQHALSANGHCWRLTQRQTKNCSSKSNHARRRKRFAVPLCRSSNSTTIKNHARHASLWWASRSDSIRFLKTKPYIQSIEVHMAAHFAQPKTCRAKVFWLTWPSTSSCLQSVPSA